MFVVSLKRVIEVFVNQPIKKDQLIFRISRRYILGPEEVVKKYLQKVKSPPEEVCPVFCCSIFSYLRVKIRQKLV